MKNRPWANLLVAGFDFWGGFHKWSPLWAFFYIAAVSGELPQPPLGQGAPKGHKCTYLMEEDFWPFRGLLLFR
jgi:hypothetical protein